MSLVGSPLLTLTDGARRPSRWWLAWLIAMVIMIVVPPFGIIVGNAVLGSPPSANAWYPYVGAFGSAAALLALWLWVRLKEGRPLATVGFRPRRSWLRLLLGFGLGAAMMSATVVLGLLFRVYGNGVSVHTVSGVNAGLALLPLALLALFQAGCSTALFPGYLLQMSARQLAAWVAVLGTSVLISVLHTLNPLSMLNLFLFAVFTALLALQQGSLWLVAGVQGGWACFQSAVFGLPVGGISAPTALFSVGSVPGSSTIITGGLFGPETGLLGTVVLAAATVVAYLLLRRTTRRAAGNSPGAQTPTPSRKEHTHVDHGI